jgi:hypothetical protein
MTTEVRAPTDAERAAIARRMDHRRRAAAAVWRSQGSELTGLGVMFGILAVAQAGALIKWPSPAFVIGFVLCATLSTSTIIGRRKHRARVAAETNEIARAQADRERAVTEVRLAADRIVVASGDDGSGEVWWFFRADDGKWLVLEHGQWEDLDPDARTWNRDIAIGLDGRLEVVSIESSGQPVAVERHDLQPPDYLPTPDTLFWSPPDDLDPMSVVLDRDPVLVPLER